jgi:hypothetical protein
VENTCLPLPWTLHVFDAQFSLFAFADAQQLTCVGVVGCPRAV